MKYAWMMLLLGTALLGGCKKVDDPEEDGAHNAITTISLKFSQGGVQRYEAVFDDPDGPGGAAPIRFDDIRLQPGQTYNVDITLTNKSKTPAEDMTATVRSEGHQHLFFFAPSGINGLAVNVTDRDRLGLPIGLTSTWTVPAGNQTGSLRVVLRHIAAGKTAGSPITAGHADLDVVFNTIIQ